jgi:hypothetical protein
MYDSRLLFYGKNEIDCFPIPSLFVAEYAS